MLRNPELTFSFMSPLVGLSVLLKNPLVREKMKFDESELTVDEKAAGHFLGGDIAKQARALLPVMPGGRPVLPLYIGWWSDSTNVSFGGILSTFILYLQICLQLILHRFPKWTCASTIAVCV